MLISILSGKGGTGKTTVSTALAASIKKLTYVDLDVEEPNGALILKPKIINISNAYVWVPIFDKEKCSFCSICADRCNFNAILVIKTSNQIVLNKEICHSCKLCEYVCYNNAVKGGRRKIGVIRQGSFNSGKNPFIEGLLNIGEIRSSALINIIKSKIKNIKGDFVLDCPPGTSCPVIDSIKGTDYAVLVAEPNPFSLSDLKMAIEIVKKFNIPFGVIVNKSDDNDNELIEFCNNNNVEILMKIEFNLDIARAISSGRNLISLKGYKEKFAEVYEKIKERVRGKYEADSVH